jgi:hypothetical protein
MRIDSIEIPSYSDATVDKVSSQSADHSDTIIIADVQSHTKTEPLPIATTDVIKEGPVPKNENQSPTQGIETPVDRTVETPVLSNDSPTVPDNRAILDENLLFPDQTATTAAESPALITEMAGLEEVRQFGSSRFGVIRLVRRAKARGGFDYFAAKYYNVGDNKEGTIGFHDCMRDFLNLGHPHVMPLLGVVDPVNTTGLILLTPYSESGSFEDVLECLRRNDPPPFWNDAKKLRMIVSS